MSCVFCNSAAIESPPHKTHDFYTINCKNCGKYVVEGIVKDTSSAESDADKALISHCIWMHQRDGSTPHIDVDFLQSCKSTCSFPSTREKINMLIDFLGAQTRDAGERLEVATKDLRAKVGARTIENVREILTGAEEMGLTSQDMHLNGASVKLTVKGRIHYDDSHRLDDPVERLSEQSIVSENVQTEAERGNVIAAPPTLADRASGLKVFIAYSEKDDAHRKNIVSHLSALERDGDIGIWHFRLISPGADWKSVIDEQISSAHLILLLISADFFASDYCYEVEMQRALERHKMKEARVVPIIIRDCDWHLTPIGTLQALPKDGIPTTKWSNWDDGYADMARGIRKVVEELRSL